MAKTKSNEYFFIFWNWFSGLVVISDICMDQHQLNIED